MTRYTRKVQGKWQGLKELKRHVDLTLLFGAGKIPCPWHDETKPSLHVYPDHLHCFGCGTTVDGVEYVMKVNELTFDEAVEWMEEHAGDTRVQLPERILTPVPTQEILEFADRFQSLPAYHFAKTYLYNRGLSGKVLDASKVGWNGYSYTIPHIANGQVVNVKFRVHPRYETPTRPKYTSLEHRAFDFLYPWDLFRAKFFNCPVVFICEGELDALVGFQYDLPFLSLPSGVATPIDQWVPFLRTRKVVYLLFDQDKAGNEGAYKILEKTNAIGKTLAEMMAPTQVRRVTWHSERGKDVTDARTWLIPKVRLLYAKEIV